MTIDLTAVVTAQEWRDRNGELSADQDSLLGTLLTTVTRVVEKRIQVAPGMLKPQTNLSFTFPAVGGSRLHLRDERGYQYLLRSITADSLKIDSDNDGAYDDYLLDTSDAWVRAYPVNASALSEPYTAIDLVSVPTATITTWPDAEACVQIIGNWGWAATPGAIKERVIGITRELIEVHRAGAGLNFASIDTEIDRIPSARMLLRMLEQEFSYKIPMFG